VTLHVEDELAAVERRAGELQVEGRVLGHIEKAAGETVPRIRGIHSQQCGRRSARRYQEAATVEAEALGVRVGGLETAAAGLVMHRIECDGRIFAVRRRVELDGKAHARGIVQTRHHALLGSSMVDCAATPLETSSDGVLGIRKRGSAHGR